MACCGQARMCGYPPKMVVLMLKKGTCRCFFEIQKYDSRCAAKPWIYSTLIIFWRVLESIHIWTYGHVIQDVQLHGELQLCFSNKKQLPQRCPSNSISPKTSRFDLHLFHQLHPLLGGAPSSKSPFGSIWGFHGGSPIAGRVTVEKPIQMDDLGIWWNLGVALFPKSPRRGLTMSYVSVGV